MLKVTVAEKGGLEHEHLFDVTTVSIGRVQGNLIVLPKPNVSKRHAMVQVEGGAVVLTDNKSTNGTYVNGRRITGPRQLSPEDRVYIGDYILRFSEVPSTTGAIEPTPLPPPPEDAAQYRATVAMPALQVEPPPPPAEASAPGVEVPLDLEVEVEPPSQESVEHAVNSQVVPTSPSERFPAELVPPPPPPVSDGSISVPSRLSAVSRRRGIPGERSGQERLVEAMKVVGAAAATTVFAQVDPASQEISDEVWQRLSDGVMRLVDRLRREGRIGPEVDPYLLTQDLLYEFLGLGPFEEMLADETIHGMMTIGREQVFLCRGDRVERAPKGFSSEEGQRRVLERLLGMAGLGREALERPFLQAQVMEGVSLYVVNAPVALGGRVIRVEKALANPIRWTDLVSEARLGQEEADEIRETLVRHGGVVLVGGTAIRRRQWADALLGSLPSNLRVVVLDGGLGGGVAGPGRICLDRHVLAGMGSAAHGLLATLRPDVLVAADLQVDDLALLARQALTGTGLLIGCPGDELDTRTLETHLVAMWMLAFPGLPESGARLQIRRMVQQAAFLKADPDGACRLALLASLQ